MKQLLVIFCVLHTCGLFAGQSQSSSNNQVLCMYENDADVWMVKPSAHRRGHYYVLDYLATISRTGGKFRISYEIVHPDSSCSKRTVEWDDAQVRRSSQQHRALLDKIARSERYADKQALECIY